MIAVVALVGCGKKTTPAEPETNAEPKVAAEKQEPPKVEPQKQEPHKAEPKTEAKIPANAFVNTLGMPFVPVKGTDVQFCIWETRVKDYAAYAAANAGVDGSWKNFGFAGFKQCQRSVNRHKENKQLFETWNRVLGSQVKQDSKATLLMKYDDVKFFGL